MTLFTAIKSWLHRLFGKDEKTAQPVNQKKIKKLSRADRKQIETAIARANRTDRKEKSAQDSIPYERMWPDGICRVADGHYTKTIQFQDINYQLSQNEDKTAIFEGWCDFLNYFDSSIQFQLSFLNLAASEETFAHAINIPLQGDDFDTIRVEYTTMLQNQLARGNNGLIKTKYLTFGIDADSLKAAKPRLERIETDILNNFKRLGVAAETLDGKARLAQLHGIFHMDEQVPFRFEWEWLAPSGLSTKDFIAPSGFEFRTGKQFRMGKKYGTVSFLQILAPELNDRIHNYFFAKALDQVRPGGVVAFVTSRYTMDAKDSTVRRYLAQRAELLGAIRLPNNAFKANAGTEVVSDIIFLQKRDRPLDIVPEWTQTGQTEDGFAINRYFLDHPEMVLGRQEPESTAHGMDYTVNPIEGLELSDQLHDAVKYIRGTYQEAELPELGEGEAIDTSSTASDTCWQCWASARCCPRRPAARWRCPGIYCAQKGTPRPRTRNRESVPGAGRRH